jgi:DNA replicative helicase MCM subunit Mcm2 (Cdc46/Mcm family)
MVKDMAKEAPKKPVPEEGRKTELVARFKELLHKKYKKALNKAALEEKALVVEFPVLSKFSYELGEALLSEPDYVFDVAREAVDAMEPPAPVTVRFTGLPEMTSIRDLRSRHIKKFLCAEGTVRRASEIRPEIQKILWECPECGDVIEAYSEVGMIRKPFACNCGNRTGFRKKESVLVDTRWVTIEEPFELTEGDRPSQVNVVLIDDLVSPDGRRVTDPGNRIKVTGILRETPKGKIFSSKLDFFISANHIEATELGWHKLDITEEEEAEIKNLARNPKVYELLVDSLAPSLYGLREIKESIILQLFGGVPQHLRDKTHIRGDIHVLLIGDPASGKSQLLKLVPEIVPRGKYVSGKGTTGAGLCTVYDSMIQLEDGSLVKIGELVERELEGNEKEHEPGITVARNPTPRNILSLTKDNAKLKPMKITQYWKLKAPGKLIRITTKSGKEITVTPNNPILTINKGILKWRNASSLTERDFIASSRNILPSENRKISLTGMIDDSSHLLNAHEAVKEISEKIRESGTIRDFSSHLGIDENKLYHFWVKDKASGNPTMGMFKNMRSELGMEPDSILPPSIKLSQYHGHEIRLPKHLNEDLMYMAGLLAGDGSISRTGYGGFDIKFSSSDEWLLEEFGRLCRDNCIEPRLEKARDRIPNQRFRSKIFAGLLAKFGIPCGKKARNLRTTSLLSSLPNNLIAGFLKGVFDTDGSVYMRDSGSSGISLDSASRDFIRGIQLLLLKFGIQSSVRSRRPTKSSIKGRPVVSGEKWTLEVRGIPNISSFRENIGLGLPRKSEKLETLLEKQIQENTNVDLIPRISNILRKARQSAGLSARELYGYENYSYENGLRNPSQKMLKELVFRLKSRGNSEDLRMLETLANSDIAWDGIRKIEQIDNKEHEHVYDVTVEDEHSFMCNGLIIHNTATVTKDEQFMGGWVLEAGAMVLANRGMLAVDEFEKMSPEDMVAMHEGLEQGTVSIAKASIVATLPAKTSVLAGGNPKFSRFDPYVPISKQIIIPDTLLSRFDLKFALRDVPDSEVDKKVVDHVLKTREDEGYEGSIPKLDPDLIRKYIAYARTNCTPKLTREAGKILRTFYIRTRKKAEGAESPVPITLRQFEALMRLAEASARVQLQTEVRKEDAQRAIKLMNFSLKQLGFTETGEIDVDKAEGGTPASERSKIRTVLDLIDNLSKVKKEISIDELRSAARAEGVDEIDEIIERLKTQGLLFEPSPGFVQKV